MQFGTRSLLIATIVVAIGVPSFAFPGGMYIYLPLLLVFLLTLGFGALFLNWLRTSPRRPFLKQWPMMAVALLLLLSASSIVMLYDVAFDRYSTVRFNETQRRRAVEMSEPVHFRDLCLDLHSRLIASPSEERVLDGSSEHLPPEIKAINPILITVSDHYINIQVTRDGGSLVAYPLDGTFPHVRSRKLADCLYYWPN
jgi:hypothetical protein